MNPFSLILVICSPIMKRKMKLRNRQLLEKEIEILRPDIIITIGRPAKTILGNTKFNGTHLVISILISLSNIIRELLLKIIAIKYLEYNKHLIDWKG
ncbi:hypothetical protein DL346_04365 [Paenibacillus montanisoli]|uniref:Uncharacterized protein n=1 Tax=Paenibacillus montanisoli TaxID=2081970 RepID=A0A328UCF2_9BACL|nr:hypothetical protein DL346_04365 [Paenibacillus montanisoli]